MRNPCPSTQRTSARRFATDCSVAAICVSHRPDYANNPRYKGGPLGNGVCELSIQLVYTKPQYCLLSSLQLFNHRINHYRHDPPLHLQFVTQTTTYSHPQSVVKPIPNLTICLLYSQTEFAIKKDLSTAPSIVIQAYDTYNNRSVADYAQSQAIHSERWDCSCSGMVLRSCDDR